MPEDYIDIFAIEAVKPEGEALFQFFLILDGPGVAGLRRLAIPADVLLSYPHVQHWILIHTGAVYRHLGVEGRSPEAQGEAWRAFLAVAMRQVAQLIPSPGPWN